MLSLGVSYKQLDTLFGGDQVSSVGQPVKAIGAANSLLDELLSTGVFTSGNKRLEKRSFS